MTISHNSKDIDPDAIAPVPVPVQPVPVPIQPVPVPIQPVPVPVAVNALQVADQSEGKAAKKYPKPNKPQLNYFDVPTVMKDMPYWSIVMLNHENRRIPYSPSSVNRAQRVGATQKDFTTFSDHSELAEAIRSNWQDAYGIGFLILGKPFEHEGRLKMLVGIDVDNPHRNEHTDEDYSKMFAIEQDALSTFGDEGAYITLSGSESGAHILFLIDYDETVDYRNYQFGDFMSVYTDEHQLFITGNALPEDRRVDWANKHKKDGRFTRPKSLELPTLTDTFHAFIKRHLEAGNCVQNKGKRKVAAELAAEAAATNSTTPAQPVATVVNTLEIIQPKNRGTVVDAGDVVDARYDDVNSTRYRNVDAPDEYILDVLKRLSNGYSHNFLHQWSDDMGVDTKIAAFGKSDCSELFRDAIGDLEKICGCPRQIGRIILGSPFMQSERAKVGEGRYGKFMGRDGGSDYFMDNLLFCRERNEKTWFSYPNNATYVFLKNYANIQQQKHNVAAALSNPEQPKELTLSEIWYEFPDNEIANRAKVATPDELMNLGNELTAGMHSPSAHVEPILARAVELYSTKAMTDGQLIELRNNIRYSKVTRVEAIKQMIEGLSMKRAAARRRLHPSYKDEFKVTQRGEFIANIYNISLMLTYDTLFAGLIAFEEFSQSLIFTRKPFWEDGVSTDADWNGRCLVDADIYNIIAMVQREGLNCKKDDCFTSIKQVAHHNRVDYVIKWLDGLKWDGVPRLDTWLHDLANAPDDEYHRTIGSRWMIGSIARSRDPGCKFDHMLILFSGTQGHGKTKLLQELFSMDYYGTLSGNFQNKDELMKLAGKRCIDFSEYAGLSKRAADEDKTFIDEREDRYRSPYGTVVETHPRRNVFSATTNQRNFHNDETGGRRMWVADVGVLPEDDSVVRVRDQLWAEADHRYRSGERYWVSREKDADFMCLAAAKIGDRTEEHPWTETVVTYLLYDGTFSSKAGCYFPDRPRPEPLAVVSPTTIMNRALGLKVGDITATNTRSMGALLRLLGYDRGSVRLNSSRSVNGWCLQQPTELFSQTAATISLPVGKIRIVVNPTAPTSQHVETAKELFGSDLDAVAAERAKLAKEKAAQAQPVPVPVPVDGSSVVPFKRPGE